MKAVGWLAWTAAVLAAGCAVTLAMDIHRWQVNRRGEIALYDQWYQYMAIARDTSHSIGEDEPPRKSATYVSSPGAAVNEMADWLRRATVMAASPAWYFAVPDSAVLQRLSGLSGAIADDMAYMYQPVSRGGARPTEAQLRSERDFLASDLDLILSRLPKQVTSVRQLNALVPQLDALTGQIRRRDERYMVAQGLLVMEPPGAPEGKSLAHTASSGRKESAWR